MWEGLLKAAGLRLQIQKRDRLEASGQHRATRLRVIGERAEGLWTWQLTAHNKHIPAELTLLPGSGPSWLLQILGVTDPTLGDPVLDDIAQVSGPPDRLLAVLDHNTRIEARTLVERGGSVRDRAVRLQTTSQDSRPDWLPERTRELSRLAGHLSVHPKRVSQGLIRAVDHDPLAGIRAEAFRILLRDHPQRVPDRLLTEERLTPLLDELSHEALVRALDALGRSGSANSLPLIAPFIHFPRGNNATRKAARRAARALETRAAPEGE